MSKIINSVSTVQGGIIIYRDETVVSTVSHSFTISVTILYMDIRNAVGFKSENNYYISNQETVLLAIRILEFP